MNSKKLPDAEFEIMRAVWASKPPVTCARLTETLRYTLPQKDWKPQTVLTMLTRLETKGFLRSGKQGRERVYDTLISQSQYMQIEAESLRQRFTGGHFSGLVKALCDTDDLTEADIADLQHWLEERSKK